MNNELHVSIEKYLKILTSKSLDNSAFNSDYELPVCAKLKDFLLMASEPFERTHLAGHVTGSACILTPALDKVLLTHHKKLQKWIQLGGHSDGDPSTSGVALKEAIEESGLSELAFFPWETIAGNPSETPVPFDFDIHEIPELGNDPRHLHYDVRYVFVAREPEKIALSDESMDLKWFSLEEANLLCKETSMQRQFAKIRLFRNSIKP